MPGLVGREELERIAPEIAGADVAAIQNFQPELALDEALHEVVPFSEEEMDELASVLSGVVGRVVVRGRDRAAAFRGGHCVDAR